MKRLIAASTLAILLLASAAVSLFPALSYEVQHREATGVRPSRAFPLGTDDLGRDRLGRLLYATRTSLVLAAASGLGALLLAVAIGGAAGYLGGFWDSCAVRTIDLMLSLPWIFLLLAARALVPLNASPFTSLVLTYALLSGLGWAAPARIIRAGVRRLKNADFVLQARAAGCSEFRVLRRHIVPNLVPVLMAQFCVSVPVFILAEANLGFLGLSASDPVPTWGNLLRELQSPLGLSLECFAPVVLIAASVLCFKLVAPVEGSQI